MNTKITKLLLRGGRRGSSVIEFGLTIIPLFMIILGSMEYAWFFCNTLILDEVVQSVSDSAATHMVNDFSDADTIGRIWETDGIALWERYGMPGKPAFRTNVQTSGGVLMVHVTGDLPGYNGLVDGFYGVTGLPADIETTVARRIDDQDLSSDILALF